MTNLQSDQLEYTTMVMTREGKVVMNVENSKFPPVCMGHTIEVHDMCYIVDEVRWEVDGNSLLRKLMVKKIER